MIVACIKDMLIFMVVLLIGVFAFADAFQSVDKKLELNGSIDSPASNANDSGYVKYGQQYVTSWQKSFMYTIGEFDGNMEFFDEYDWLIFFLCVIFNIILLLNLLIAIISETFATIAASAVANSYKEKAIQME